MLLFKLLKLLLLSREKFPKALVKRRLCLVLVKFLALRIDFWFILHLLFFLFDPCALHEVLPLLALAGLLEEPIVSNLALVLLLNLAVAKEARRELLRLTRA